MGFTNCRYNTSKLADALGVSEQNVKNAMADAAYGGYAKVWAVENKGNYSQGQVSVSKKNKDTGTYETEFQHNFVRFVGTAHNTIQQCSIPQDGLSIRITSCDVTRRYDKQAQKEYTNFAIFGFEPLVSGYAAPPTTNTNSGRSKPKDEPVFNDPSDDDLPF